jgi:hypothetical protein
MCQPDGGNPSGSIGFILRCEIIFCILVLAYKTTASHVSYIGSGRMTISVVSLKIDSDNMLMVEMEH